MSRPTVNDFKAYLEQFEVKSGILSGLGIIGWDSYERAVESFLLLGGSLLLVGPHGIAKTMLSKRLAQALGVSFASYDTSKSMWEDIMGFPDPAKLMNLETRGTVTGLPRIETPTSIWGKRFVLADEINRCFDDKTDVLTAQGWKHFSIVTKEDKLATLNTNTNMLEYQVPTKILSYSVDEKLLQVSNAAVDFCVTKDHTMLVKEYRSKNSFGKCKADSIPWYSYMLPVTCDYVGKPAVTFTLPQVKRDNRYSDLPDKEIPINTWLTFLGFFISEGGLAVKSINKGSYHLTLVNKTPSIIEKINTVLTNLCGITWDSKVNKKDGCTHYNVYGKNLTLWLYENVGGYCHEKRIPRQFLELDKNHLEVLFDALILGDGYKKDTKNGRLGNSTSGVYQTTSPQLADDVQELAFKLGYRVKIRYNKATAPNHHDLYSVNFFKSDRTKNVRVNKTEDTEFVDYCGMVYCAETPNHTLVTRRNNKILISGNCTPENQSKWLELILDQTMMGEQTGTKWIISAMNPGYAGTNPLDLALVARYLYFISAPTAAGMSNDELTRILQLENNTETPAMPTWELGEIARPETALSNPAIEVSDTLSSLSQDTIFDFIRSANLLKAILIVAADAYPSLTALHSEAIDTYIVTVAKALLKEAKFEIDIRRLRMIKRAIVANMAIEKAVSAEDTLDFRVIQDSALQTLLLSFPTIAGIDGPTVAQIKTVHTIGKDCLVDKNNPVYLVLLETDPLKRVKKMLELCPTDKMLHYKVFSEILEEGSPKSLLWAFALLIAYKNGLKLSGSVLSALGKCFYTSLSTDTAIITTPETTSIPDLLAYRKECTVHTFGDAIAMYITMLEHKNLSNLQHTTYINSVKSKMSDVRNELATIYNILITIA